MFKITVFKASIGYDVSRAVLVSCPPDSVCDIDCTVIYAANSSRNTSSVCTKCNSLKWQLCKRKCEHDELAPLKKIEWQSSNSKVPFDVLSRHSKKARFKSMSSTIHHHQPKVEYFSKRIDCLSASDFQNNEIGQLVSSNSDSSDGKNTLNEIFSEADSIHRGLEGVVKGIWEDDVSNWKQFLENQKGVSILVIVVRS